MTVCCYLFTDQIVSAFLTGESAFDHAVQFAGILLSTSALFGVFYVLTNALQAMGAAVSGLYAMAFRKTSRVALEDQEAVFSSKQQKMEKTQKVHKK